MLWRPDESHPLSPLPKIVCGDLTKSIYCYPVTITIIMCLSTRFCPLCTYIFKLLIHHHQALLIVRLGVDTGHRAPQHVLSPVVMSFDSEKGFLCLGNILTI